MSKVILYVGFMLLVILIFTNMFLALVLAVVLCFGGSLYWCYTRSRHHPDSVDNPPAPISLENAQQQQSTHQLSVSAPMGSDDVRTTIDMRARTTLGRILKPVEEEYSLTSTDTDISPAPYACLDTDEAVPVKSFNEESDTECHNCALEEQQTHNQPPIVLSADFGDNEVLAIEELACTICLIEYQHGDEIQRNGFSDTSKSCDHIFHPECITTWIRTSCNAECPCCRRPFLVPIPPV
jgi:hypothetical protein